jgi:heptosyltransferase-2
MMERFVEKRMLWPLVVALSSVKGKRKKPAKIAKIAVLRLWALGESILVLPMLRELKKRFPDAEITVFCTKGNAGVFKGQGFVGKVRVVWTKDLPGLAVKEKGAYDVCIDTEPHFNISAIIASIIGKYAIGYSYGARGKLYDAPIEYNDKQHAVFTICDLLKPLGGACRPKELVRLRWSKEDGEKAKGMAAGLGRPIIGIHPGCGGTAPWREWPESRFAELINRMADTGGTFVITGAKNEQGKIARIISGVKDKESVFVPEGINVPQLFALISGYDLMISNDTGPMHISAAQGVPTIGLFGPNTPVRFGPFPPKKNIAIYHEKECRPCINVHKGEFRKCPHAGKCMKAITVGEVLSAARRLLGRK